MIATIDVVAVRSSDSNCGCSILEPTESILSNEVAARTCPANRLPGSWEFLELSDLEATDDWIKILVGVPDIGRMIVAGDDDFLWTNFHCVTFHLGEERVSVCPDLEMMAKDVVLLVEVFNQHGVFLFITIPPFVTHFKVSIRILRTSATRFSSAGRAPEPLVFLGAVVQLSGFQGAHVVAFNALVVLEADLFVDVGETSFGCSKAGIAPELGSPGSACCGVFRAVSFFEEVAVLRAVGPILLSGPAGGFDMAAGHLSLKEINRTAESARGLEIDVPLKMRGPVFSYFLSEAEVADDADGGEGLDRQEGRRVVVVVREGVASLLHLARHRGTGTEPWG